MKKINTLTRLAAATALMLLFAACDGLLLGGEEAARIPLQPAADGGYAPVRILLRPGMNPVSFSLHAGFAWGKHDEGGQWNSYRATLSADGRVIHSEDFQVNSPERGGQAQSASPPSSLQQRMMRVDLPAEAEYEFTIASLKPAVVTLDAPQLVVRVNVSRL